MFHLALVLSLSLNQPMQPHIVYAVCPVQWANRKNRVAGVRMYSIA
jgi:hypothetical protein